MVTKCETVWMKLHIKDKHTATTCLILRWSPWPLGAWTPPWGICTQMLETDLLGVSQVSVHLVVHMMSSDQGTFFHCSVLQFWCTHQRWAGVSVGPLMVCSSNVTVSWWYQLVTYCRVYKLNKRQKIRISLITKSKRLFIFGTFLSVKLWVNRSTAQMDGHVQWVRCKFRKADIILSRPEKNSISLNRFHKTLVSVSLVFGGTSRFS